MSTPRPLKMQISLNALEHLGMNLYSNVPSVLSEIVANAWDADAAHVQIVLNKTKGTIVIDDDGTGMTRDEVIERFLRVGFRRRVIIGDETSKGRRPMGRKGIGKLSTFSVAKIVEVYTERDDERTGFRMDREAIRTKIESGDDDLYQPVELTSWPADHLGGTRILLSGLETKLTAMTSASLRRRVARRFSIIGPKHGFRVTVDGQEITVVDRGYHHALQYLWTYGDQSDLVGLAKSLGSPSVDRSAEVAAQLEGLDLTLGGWIGRVASPSQLKDEEGDNLNRIAVFMRGKLAQEDMLDELGQKEIYADYVIGELHCDELDLADAADIAMSSRQALKQDDPRYVKLREVVLGELRHIAGRWSELRREEGTKVAREIPAVAEWLDGLQGDVKRKAQRWVGRLNTIRSDRDEDRRELLKASILAFESYWQRERLDALDEMSADAVQAILPVFQDVDALERSYYGQIVRMRLAVIKKLREMLKEDVKEKVLQQHVFDHLWLIDPSWERAKGSQRIETKIGAYLEENTEKLSDEERRARIDIAYRTAVGSHVIIEMKRTSAAIPIDRLVAQVRKYRTGVRKLLAQGDRSDWPLEIICLVGTPPPEWNDITGRVDIANALGAVDARLVFYDKLVENAEKSYADYLEEHRKIDRLWTVFESIDDFVPGPLVFS